ncbi:20S proteasome subunit alpha [Tubulinosema ratisbonensis]|uniref:20S proteasome subunit alpha n=1 Tax=Tubulinosema ratisbonensis TaxID=291195 RepID=A0A437AP77_9MICR|nr:20S proteasome subunit alpha [Tubulinosema ratisbonensis]
MQYSQYETVDTFTPEGKVKALEYIKNSVELGNTTIALGNKNCGILLAYNGKKSVLTHKQPKIFKISDKALFSFAGITNDGLDIVKYLVDYSVWEEIYKGRDIHPVKVFDDLCREAIPRTIYSGNRMFGCGGILLSRYKNEIVLTEFEPTGNVQLVHAVSVGNRSQSAKTILENYYDSLESADKNTLIKVALEALKNAHPDEELTNENVEIWCLEEKASFVESFNF